MFLKVITTVSAYIKLLDPTPATKWVNWTKVGQIWAKFGPNWIGVPILIITLKTLPVSLVLPRAQLLSRTKPTLGVFWVKCCKKLILVHLKSSKDWHYVSGALRVLMTLKIYSELKSRVSEVKNRGDIFHSIFASVKVPDL